MRGLAGMLCPEYLSLTQVRWTQPVGVIFYGHHPGGHNLITFVRIMCAITDFNFGSVCRIHSLVGPGITYRALLRGGFVFGCDQQ